MTASSLTATFRQGPDAAVVRLQNIGDVFGSAQVGDALARHWALSGKNLVPVVDRGGEFASCPITGKPMQEPVLLDNGLVYEQKDVLVWMRDHSTAPGSNKALGKKTALKLSSLNGALQTFLLRGRTALDLAVEKAKEACNPERQALSPREAQEIALEVNEHLGETTREIRRLQEAALEAESVVESMLFRSSAPGQPRFKWKSPPKRQEEQDAEDNGVAGGGAVEVSAASKTLTLSDSPRASGTGPATPHRIGGGVCGKKPASEGAQERSAKAKAWKEAPCQ